MHDPSPGGRPFLDRVAFVIFLLTFGNSHNDFGQSFIINKRRVGIIVKAIIAGSAFNLPQFLFSQQQLAVTASRMVIVCPLEIFCHIHILHPQFPFSTIQNVSTRLAFPKRIDLISVPVSTIPAVNVSEQLIIESRPLVLYLYVITNLLFHLILLSKNVNRASAWKELPRSTRASAKIRPVAVPTNFRRIFSSTCI